MQSKSRKGQPSVAELNVGDMIQLTKERTGYIRFKGKVEHDPSGEIHFGVELIGSMGKNSGTVKGVEYFKCEKNRGMLVKMDRVRKKIDPKDLTNAADGGLAKLGVSARTLGLEQAAEEDTSEEEGVNPLEWTPEDVCNYVNENVKQDGEAFREAGIDGTTFMNMTAKELKGHTRKYKQLRQFMNNDFHMDL